MGVGRTNAGGKMVKSRETLFYSGNLYEDLTGGWGKSGYTYGTGGYTIKGASIGDTILMSVTSGSHTCICGTQNKIDLYPFNTLCVDVLQLSGNVSVSVDTNKQGRPADADAYIQSSEPGIMRLDISSISAASYVVLTVTGTASTPTKSAEMGEIWLER